MIILSIISFLVIDAHAGSQTIHGGHYRNFFVASGDTVIVSGDILVQKNLTTNGAVQYNASPKSNLVVLGDIIKTQSVYGGRHGNASINNDIIGRDQSHHYFGENTKTDSHFFVGHGASVSRITENNKDKIPQNIKDMILTYAPHTEAGKALPVNLIFFKGEVNENNVTLLWETASEQNSKEFILLVSDNNGKKFKQLKKIKAGGNSNTVLKYEYTDRKVSYGNHIYKLIERDFDGKEQSWTQLINVSSHLMDDRVLNVYPIPCRTILNIELYNLGENDELDIEMIHASTGQKIQVVHEEESEEYHQQLNVANIESGVYFLIINDNGRAVFKKEIIIQH
ncbi:T9SS type A sorting domain-containing protein [Flammeovirga aprica]|uniref:T9SS type A sorting domain-containing protein n=1 Tax=Flammeovirga aprica JL-4 TaxID=694437 RepID=A0A7X9XDI4_9BACT|nr:T9SS type A sorting domain-containing protein [Flammeovirga aprica]NME72882.1 T9SS type A sorting domain-containing protein [Flammeovirga aprica JL-4]